MLTPIPCTQFSDVVNFTELSGSYMYRPWMRAQNKGYINYTRTMFSDHSFSYDDQYFEDPPAQRHQLIMGKAYGWSKHALLDVLGNNGKATSSS
jgi:hypothetical protein